MDWISVKVKKPSDCLWVQVAYLGFGYVKVYVTAGYLIDRHWLLEGEGNQRHDVFVIAWKPLSDPPPRPDWVNEAMQ